MLAGFCIQTISTLSKLFNKNEILIQRVRGSADPTSPTPIQKTKSLQEFSDLCVHVCSSQQTHNVATTSLQGRCNVVTLQRRCVFIGIRIYEHPCFCKEICNYNQCICTPMASPDDFFCTILGHIEQKKRFGQVTFICKSEVCMPVAMTTLIHVMNCTHKPYLVSIGRRGLEICLEHVCYNVGQSSTASNFFFYENF